MKRMNVFIGALLFLLMAIVMLSYYAFWGYSAWVWIQPDSFLSFFWFLLVWSALSWAGGRLLGWLLKLSRPYIPLVDRVFERAEERKREKALGDRQQPEAGEN